MSSKQHDAVKPSVCVVGLGYVGLPLLQLLLRDGYHATGLDTNPRVIEKIQEPATSSSSILKTSDIVILCVPTPVTDDKRPDYEPLISAVNTVAKYLHKGQLIVLESTVNPGASEQIVIETLEKVSGLKAGADFYFAYCPERINPGDDKWNVENIPRVLGANDSTSLKLAGELYKNLIKANITEISNIKEVEAVKVVENAFRDINIAFVNELAMSFAKLDINVKNVIDAAATKPFGFIPHYPGVGVGGHCIPVDPYYLIESGEKSGFDHRFLKLARQINDEMPKYTLDQLKSAVAALDIESVDACLLGVAYKANVSDYRESPAFPLIEATKAAGYNLRVYDPHVPEYSTVSSLDEALSGANCLLIVTDHDEFKSLDIKGLANRGIKIIVDGRNCLARSEVESAGIKYVGIGT